MAADLHPKSAGDVLPRSVSTGLAVLMAVRPAKYSRLIRRSPKPCRAHPSSSVYALGAALVGQSRRSSYATVRVDGSQPWLPNGTFHPERREKLSTFSFDGFQ